MTNKSRKPVIRSIVSPVMLNAVLQDLKRFVIPALVLHALVLAGAAPALAQSPGEGPIVLRLPSSARIAAMANAGIASNDGDALLYNPGMVTVSRGAALSLQRFGSNATAGAFGSATVSGGFTYGLGVQFLDWRAPARPYADAVLPGATHLSDSGTVGASSTAFTVAVARVIKGFRVGIGVKYAEERFGPTSDGTVAMDLGLSRSVGPAALAFTVQNMGPGVRLDGTQGILPRRIGLGFGSGMVPIEEYFDLGAQMQLTAEGDEWFVRPAAGVEVGYVPIEGVAFVLRTGLRRPREKDESVVTGGLGLNIDRYSFDYAIEPYRGGRPVSHRVGFRVR